MTWLEKKCQKGIKEYTEAKEEEKGFIPLKETSQKSNKLRKHIICSNSSSGDECKKPKDDIIDKDPCPLDRTNHSTKHNC